MSTQAQSLTGDLPISRSVHSRGECTLRLVPNPDGE
jgi:hypothetical protein